MFDSDMLGRTTPLGRLLAVVVAFAFVALPATQATALDKDQIIQMSKMGIETDAIKGAIDSSEESFKLTPEEIGELRAQGVSDEVISYLKETGHVTKKKGKEKEKKKKQDQKKAAEKKKDEKEGDEAAPPAPGDEAEGEKKKEAKKGDDEGTAKEDEGTTPAPAPGAPAKGEEKKELTKEEIQELKREARKEGKQKLKKQERKQQRLQRVARKLPEADRKLQNDQNMEAARVYLKFLAIGPKKGSENWYEAKFGLAKALYKEGILSGATTPTQQVVMAGADRPHFEEAFRMLEELTRKIGYQPPALEELTGVLVKDQAKPFRNDFNYYLGKFFYDYDRNKLALKYLEKLKEGAEDYPEARYLMGVAQLDPAIDDKPAALRNFEKAITAGERQSEANKEILNLGYLALARVFYEVGIYDVALYYYGKIPRSSSRHAEAMFEQAWTYFLKNDYKKALGTFHTLHSPYYEKWYFPDLYILESTVYLNLCKFNYSKRALAQFQKTYLDKRPRLKKFLRKTKKPKQYWTKMTRAFQSGGIAKNGTLPPMFANAVLNDLEFFNIYQVIRLLRKERRALKSNIGSLGDFGQKVLDRVNKQLQTKIQEGGILVQQKLTEISQELKKWDLKATQISFDIDSEEKEQLERRLRNKETKDGVRNSGATLLIVSDDWQAWPFEGEYWFDEVSNYRSRQSSRCIEKKQ